MSELEDFIRTTLPRQIQAEEALHNGDPQPRLDMWSTKNPVTLFGGWGPCKIVHRHGDLLPVDQSPPTSR